MADISPRFVSQLMAPKRRTVEDSQGRKRREYVSTGDEGDDMAHAGVYALVAREMWNLRAYVQTEAAAAEGSQMPDEGHGFGDDDDYNPGFGR